MAKRVFISHAAADAPLAALFHHLLLVSGVPRDQIFYSSDRSTGVPAGRSSRQVLREALQGEPFVIELISSLFMTRPMCLMELGAAWVQELETFPVVVPPLTRGQVILQIGDAHLPVLGDAKELDELFDEMQDRIATYLQISLPSAQWNPAVRDLKDRLPAVLSSLTSGRCPQIKQIANKCTGQLHPTLGLAFSCNQDQAIGQSLQS